MNKKIALDIAERVIWTTAQVLVAYAITNQAQIPGQYVVIIAPVLAVLKGIIAQRVGDPNSAAIFPTNNSVE